VPESIAKELTSNQSQSSLNLIVNSPRVQSAMRHIRPVTTLANNQYIPESLSSLNGPDSAKQMKSTSKEAR
jgi:hypothetical protein